MPTLKLDGDAQGAVKATTEVSKGYDRIGKSARDANKEAVQFERTAQRILRDNETKQETYNRKWTELAVLVKRGKLTIDEAAVALNRYRREAEGARQSNMAAFGSSALSAMSGVLGAGGLIALGAKALGDYNSELDSILEKLKSRSGGVAQLSQFAINSPNPEKAFRSLVGEARSAQGAVASGDLNEAANLVGALKGASLGKRDRDYLIDLQRRQVVESATDLAPSIAAFQASYPGMTAKQIVGMGLGTADVGSSKLHELVREMGPSAVGAQSLGWQPSWVLGAGGLLDRAFASPSEGGTRLAQFQKQFGRYGLKNYPELAGKGPLEVLDFIASETDRGNNRPALEKFVGNRGEAMEAVRVLTIPENRAALAQQIQKAEAAEGRGLADRFAGLPDTVDFLRTGRAMRTAEGKRNDSMLDAATVPGLFRAVVDEQLAETRRQYERGDMGWMESTIRETAYLAAPPLLRAVPGQWLERLKLRMAYNASEQSGALSPELMEDIRAKLDEIAGTNREMNRKTPSRQPSGRAE